MKKKNIFLTILCALCIISSCIVTSFYPNVSTATPTKLPETLEQNLTAFILAKKLEQDPKYEYITFEKDTPEDIQKDIKNCVMTGEIIEQYPEDYPYPSCLVYGMDSKGKPIHVVLCDTGESSKIITAYYPNIEVFKEDLKTRRER